uniref:Uncharacterized protein n=1 Tax=Arundo donax TaxID=35708 RepID=A0A0A9AH58_ARUDO
MYRLGTNQLSPFTSSGVAHPNRAARAWT